MSNETYSSLDKLLHAPELATRRHVTETIRTRGRRCPRVDRVQPDKTPVQFLEWWHSYLGNKGIHRNPKDIEEK